MCIRDSYDNGIKLIDSNGEKMPEDTLLLIEDYIDGKLHVFDRDWTEPVSYTHLIIIRYMSGSCSSHLVLIGNANSSSSDGLLNAEST